MQAPRTALFVDNDLDYTKSPVLTRALYAQRHMGIEVLIASYNEAKDVQIFELDGVRAKPISNVLDASQGQHLEKANAYFKYKGFENGTDVILADHDDPEAGAHLGFDSTHAHHAAQQSSAALIVFSGNPEKIAEKKAAGLVHGGFDKTFDGEAFKTEVQAAYQAAQPKQTVHIEESMFACEANPEEMVYVTEYTWGEDAQTDVAATADVRAEEFGGIGLPR